MNVNEEVLKDEASFESIGLAIGNKFRELESRIVQLEDDKKNSGAKNFIKNLKLSMDNK